MSDDVEGFDYLLIDLKTGMMDGMYLDIDDATRLKEFLQEKYKGSFWVVFKRMTERKTFKGFFPPDHLFHADVAENFGYNTEEYFK
jgi:Holliday junction resolvase